MNPRLLALVLVAYLAGCDDEQITPDPPDPNPCDEGWVDDGGECVPEDCGLGTWGDLDLGDDPSAVVYVDAAAGGTGDGSPSAPFQTLAEAVEAAEGGETSLIVLAAGTYRENLGLNSAHKGLHLAGRCADMVVLDGSGDPQVPILDFGGAMASDSYTLSGLTFTGAEYQALALFKGSYDLHDLVLAGNAGVALEVYGTGTQASLERVEIRDTACDTSGANGHAIDVTMGADLVATDCLLTGNAEVAIYAASDGTTVDLQGVQIHQTAPNGDGDYGAGIMVWDRAELTAESCQLDGNALAGVWVFDPGSTATLTEVIVRYSDNAEVDDMGRALMVDLGASLEARDCLLEENAQSGVYARASGTEVILSGVEILGPATSTGGRGIEIYEGAHVQVSDSVLDHSHEVGVYVANSTIDLEQVEIRDTHTIDGRQGIGILAYGDSIVAARDTVLDGNTEVALLATEGTAVDLERVDILNTEANGDGEFGRGIILLDGATLEARDTVLDGNSDVGLSLEDMHTQALLEDTQILNTRAVGNTAFGYGISLKNNATLEAWRCEIAGNRGIGVQSVLFSDATLYDTVIRGTQLNTMTASGVGAAVGDAATVTLVDSVLQDNRGPGMTVIQGTGRCDGCEFEGNEFAGAVCWTGSLEVTDSTMGSQRVHANLGGGFGIYVQEGSAIQTRLILSGTEIAAQPVAAVWLDATGEFSITDNTLTGGTGLEHDGLILHGNALYAGEGIQAWDGESGLLLMDNLFQDSADPAVLLDGSSASLSGNTYLGNVVDLSQQQCDGLDPPDGYQEATNLDLCPEYDRLVIPVFYYVYPETSAEY